MCFFASFFKDIYRFSVSDLDCVAYNLYLISRKETIRRLLNRSAVSKHISAIIDKSTSLCRALWLRCIQLDKFLQFDL